MTTPLSRALPQPNNWQDFERLSHDLYKRLWETNDAELHGRTGQPQAGVDVYGKDRKEGRFVGVQCKGKNSDYGHGVTEGELIAEIEKAKNFEPPIELFILATTAPNDQKIQAKAREISLEHRQKGLFEVQVKGWDTLKQDITDYPDLLRKHFPDLAPDQTVLNELSKISSLQEEQKEETKLALENIQQTLYVSGDIKSSNKDELAIQIAENGKQTKRGEPRAALRALEELLEMHKNSASNRNLSSLNASIGIAHLNLGDDDKAKTYLEKAHDHDPKWSKGRSFLAIKHFLDGDTKTAYALALDILKDDPSCENAVNVMLDAAGHEMSLAELEALIPSALRENNDIIGGLMLRAQRMEDFVAAETYARQVLKKVPDDFASLSVLGTCLVRPVLEQEGIAVTKIIPEERRSQFREGLAHLKQAWDLLKHRSDAARSVHIAVNLYYALEVAGRTNEADVVIDDALKIDPNSPPLIVQYARRMVANQDWQAVRDALARLYTDTDDFEAKYLYLQALIHTGDAEEALHQAKLLAESLDKQSRHFDAAGTLIVEAAAECGQLEHELDSVLKTYPDSLIVHYVLQDELSSDHPLQTEIRENTDRLSNEAEGPGDIYHAAQYLYKTGEFSKAADLFASLHDTHTDTPTLRRHLKSLYFADRRPEARELFEKLSLTIQGSDNYIELGIAIYDRCGQLQKARELVEIALGSSDKIELRLIWIALCERLGDRTVTNDWLKALGGDVLASPMDLLNLALAFDRYALFDQALHYGYRALREGYGEEQVHLGYSFGLIMAGGVGRHPIEHPLIVEPDAAVILQEIDGKRHITRIIETSKDPKVLLDEISSTSSLAKKLIGLKVGDIVSIDGMGAETKEFQVTSIQNKYLFAHSRSLDRFEELFPESRAFASFKIDEREADNEQFKPLFDAAKARAEFADKIVSAYRTGQVPLAFAARISGSSVFDLWEGILHRPDVPFNVVHGFVQEYQEANSLFTTFDMAVVDPITIYGLVRLGIAESVLLSSSKVGVVQTTIDMFRSLVHERENLRGKKLGSLAWDGDRYVMHEATEHSIEESIEIASKALNICEQLKPVSSEGSQELSLTTREVFDDMPPAFLDSFLAAQKEDYILLSDDRLFRELAKAEAGVSGLWSQAFAIDLLHQGKLAHNEYMKVTNQLISAQFHFTSINGNDILHSLEQAEWKVTDEIATQIRVLARTTNYPPSVISILSGLFHTVWLNTQSHSVFRRVLESILQGFVDEGGTEHALVAFEKALGHLRAMYAYRARLMACKSILLSSTHLATLQPTAMKFSIGRWELIENIQNVLRDLIENN